MTMEKIDTTTSEEGPSGEKIAKRSHESLFGFLISFILVVLVVTIASYGGWLLYGSVKESRMDADRVSIEDIPKAVKSEESQPGESLVNTTEDVTTDKTPASEPVAVNKKVAIKVLNGGITKGAAGVVARVLTDAGFAAVSTGNATGDYTGVTVYFKTPATEADANAVKETLLLKYPGVVVKQAVASNTDTNAGAVTAIVGK